MSLLDGVIRVSVDGFDSALLAAVDAKADSAIAINTTQQAQIEAANATAASAQTTASAANTAATDALAVATQAQGNVSAATTAAATAQTTATAAQTAAASAQSTANAAQAAAASAQTTATAAQTTASTADAAISAHVGSTGTAHGVASGAAAGFMSAADFTKLGGVESGAQVTSESRVRSALATATAPLNFNAQPLTAVGAPTSGSDAATKAYVDTASASGAAATAAAATSAATANTAAAAAQSTANGAATSAATAQSAANAAQSTADGAATSAATANTAAAAAQSTANAAQSAAATADAKAVTAQTNLTAHAGAGGAAHAVASASAAGFMTAEQYASLAAANTKLAGFVPGQAATIGRVTVDAILETPQAFAYAPSYQLDPWVKNDFAASNVLTGNITFTFESIPTGAQGLIAVRQDATGGRTVTFTPPGGWTIYRDANTPNLVAASGANAITVYTYAAVQVGGVNMLFIGKLTPVAV